MYKVMAVNAGSSSLKYKLFEMPEEKVICSGLAERIGHEDGIFKIKFNGQEVKEVLPILDHSRAVELTIEALLKYGIVKTLDEIKCLGHRVVQGGKYFSKSADFNQQYTEDKIAELIPLDPLHAPAHLTGFHAFKDALPNCPAIAVFDTAFHQTMEPEDYLFPIPYEMSEKFACRRYGAHGTSHNYLADKAIAEYLGGKKNTRIITCHVGSGASLAAVRDGKCVATSMGLTPLGGVMMGTRSGDIDPSVCNYLVSCTGKTSEEVYDILNKKSGLLGVSGVSNDSRDVEEAANKGDERSIIACKRCARRVADYIGKYSVRRGGAAMLIYSAGIGENSAFLRELILKDVEEALGLDIDYKVNVEKNHQEVVLSTEKSKILVAVIPTDEEVMIARDCVKFLEGTL
ncbi:MAG: acetate kinase [Bacilli bacterium]|nr:acetate kinase [Bacilli bacterium]